MPAGKKIFFTKNYTRDTSLIIQQIWFEILGHRRGGRKIATKVLKDGDMVEVDANQGIVKIIKRA